MSNIYDCIIIGGGSSGLFCGSSFPNKINGLILESSKNLGLKLLMSGGGSCNITHDGSIKDFIQCYFEHGKKLRNVLYKYNNLDVMEFFKSNGVALITREDGKVFPKSMSSKDVLDCCVNKCKSNGFSIKTQEKADKILIDNKLFIINTNKGSYKCKSLVIATGGCSYPTTGSDGNFFGKLKELNIKITPLVQSLAPIFVNEYPYQSLQGISFQNVEVTAIKDGKILAKESGPMVFTDSCFSGPAIMHISRYLSSGDMISINYINTSDVGNWKKETNSLLNSSKMSPSNFLASHTDLPKSFLKELESQCVKPKDITARLVSDKFTVNYVAGFNKAMVTRGGIDISQLNLKSMELKLIENLFAIGEVLDVDGRTGGYNLQFAYSSAKAAAMTIHERLNNR